MKFVLLGIMVILLWGGASHVLALPENKILQKLAKLIALLSISAIVALVILVINVIGKLISCVKNLMLGSA